MFSLLSKKVDKDAFKCLTTKINQKFVQMALGKKIRLVNDQEDEDGEEGGRLSNGASFRRSKGAAYSSVPRFNVRRTVFELSQKLASCVSQN